MSTKSDSRAPASAPYCAPFDPATKPPRLKLPVLACDCHAHICGPASDYAYAAERIYTPPDALLVDYLKMLEIIGIDRMVLVQPSVYGSDNRVMLQAMAATPLPCRGVAVVDSSVEEPELDRLHQAGIRGIRFNLVDVRDPSGKIALGQVRNLAARVAPLGWHVEFLIHADDYPDLDRMFNDFPSDVVFGHLGYLRPPLSTAVPGFQALLRLLQSGRCWVKLTGPTRISAAEVPYPDVVPVARALVAAAPERIIWGSDWPHVKLAKPVPNDGDLVDLLTDWIPDSGQRRQVLVDNPAVLYGFAE